MARPNPDRGAWTRWLGWVVAGAAILALVAFRVRAPRREAPAPGPQDAPLDLPAPGLAGAEAVPLPFRNSGAPAPAAIPLSEVVARGNAAVVQVETERGSGSAFYVGPDTLLTSLHVVDGSSYVTLRGPGGGTVTAYLGGTARDFDLAVLKASGARPGQAFLPLGAAADLQAGQEVLALGSPLRMRNSVSRGIVSGLRRMGQALVVQTDAALNPGNSGGPLLDRSGNVVGINAFVARAPEAGAGLSFAVAIEHGRALLEGRDVAGAVTWPENQDGRDAPGLPGTSPLTPSEQQRSQGARVYEARLAYVAQYANSLDDAWEAFRAAGYEGPLEGTGAHGWYQALDGQVQPSRIKVGFERTYASIRSRAEGIRKAMAKCEEEARQADVLPGTRRELQQRYRLDYAGWNP